MLALVLALSLAIAGQATRRADETILVSAAISLSDVLQEIATVYEEQGGGPVRFNFAASNVLARQIANGAPADLFISADERQMDHVAERGMVDLQIPLLRTRLTLITPPGRGGSVPDVAALTRVRRIAVGDPAAVPAGLYAKEFLQKSGAWDSVRPKLLPLASVRAALKAVESGGADAGIVYESDAVTSGVDIGFVVSGPAAPRIVYPAAILKSSNRKPQAARFLEFLRGRTAAEIFERHRFCRLYLPSDEGPPTSGPCAPASVIP